MAIKKLLISASLLAVLSMGITPCLAHDFWTTCPEQSSQHPLKIKLGYGHQFPKTESLDAELMMPIYLVGPKGKILTHQTDEMEFSTKNPLTKGTYIVVGGRKLRFYTKSPTGTHDKTKDQVDEAFRCVQTVKYSKSIVNIDGANEDVSKPIGHGLEIVPKTNPANLKAGDMLCVQVLLGGKPLAKAEVMGTFQGFTKEGKAMAFYSKTDKTGNVKVKLWHKGLWLLRTYHKVPYKDQSKCDNFAQTAVLTFGVK